MKTKPDINAQDENGDTALHYAVKNDAVESLSCLLKNNANVSILNNDMNGPIHTAVILNKVNILEARNSHIIQCTIPVKTVSFHFQLLILYKT